MLLPARRFLRRSLPAGLRLRIARVRRAARDRRTRVRFATRRGGLDGLGEGLPETFATYRLPVASYPGQDAWHEAKVRNLRLTAEALDGVLIESGETCSLWALAGEPSARRGYGVAAWLVDGDLIGRVGGSTCLLSTVVYNTALLGGLRIDERYPHSVDLYGEDRYFDLGRDASIEYGYRDLRFTNVYSFPVVLRVRATEDAVASWLEAATSPGDARIEVTAPEHGRDSTLRVRTRRTMRTPPGEPAGVPEDLGESVYRVPSVSG